MREEVLVVGGPSLADEIRTAGLHPVGVDSDSVVAVVQGWSPDLDWPRLAEGAYAIRRGALWMATNVDATLPTERGLAPGNGSMVAALRHATGVEPDVAGKPEPGMFTVAANDVGSRSPLVVGDRLDTDIEGANRAGMDSLLVLTGVDSIATALHAQYGIRADVNESTLIEMYALPSLLPRSLADSLTVVCVVQHPSRRDGDPQHRRVHGRRGFAGGDCQ